MNTEQVPRRGIDATDYPELNAVLRTFVADVRSILAENFCGAYLQGSFALGEADEHSDVDFLIVTQDESSEEQWARLQAMHKRIYAVDVPWAQHLEGSYVSREQLRRVDPSGSPYPFLDNGASELVSANHFNTAVVRWLIREHGVVLAGPEPRSLIDPVSEDQLRREARARIDEYAAWAPEPTEAEPMSRWKQPYLVITFCRLLNTLATEGGFEAGSDRLGSRRRGRGVGIAHPTSPRRPARPMAPGSLACRHRGRHGDVGARRLRPEASCLQPARTLIRISSVVQFDGCAERSDRRRCARRPVPRTPRTSRTVRRPTGRRTGARMA